MAFMLSPGVLFPAGYLFLYLSTNIYLNAGFKTNLSKSIEKATGNTWKTRITSIKSGWGFDSMTLNHVELTKAANRGMRADDENRTITINTIEIPYPDLQKLLFSSTERLASTNALCEIILAEKGFDQ
jgi:hypothetical protein